MRSLALIAAVTLGCAHLPRPAARRSPPTIPPPADVEALLPPKRPPITVNPRAPVFPTQPLDAGACPGYPEGNLLSDHAYARLLDAKSERDRLAVEAAELRNKERALCLQAEQVYARWVAELETALAHERRWSAWKVGLGFLAGGLLVLGTSLASRR